ncbi:MAG: DUF1816 domain-containing protein [Leptolyngbya sp. LCM1.Bin17]|jgi:hypothetical protein|nr:MAG: DUF1816 domain-containing protein [Leptolyngbya sp. LCM1.Bin17]
MKTAIGRFLSNLFGGKKFWWVEIKTNHPACTYYFGPFDTDTEAEVLKGGYIEDLEQEGAQNIRAVLLHCSTPDQLTISDEADSPFADFSTPVLGQS